MLRNLPYDSNMSKAVIMGIALASNIGGMLSPIASPQNVVALGIMEPPPTWGQWLFIAIPVGIVSLFLIWILLLLTFHPGKGTTIVPIRSVREEFTGLQWFVSFVCVATIGLWCASHALESTFGHMGVIAILPIVIFFGVGILTKEDFNNFPWTIIILAAGGLSLGKAVESSGLLHTVAAKISAEVHELDLYVVLLIFSALALVIATFISHTVAALILLPLVQNIGQDMLQPHPNLLVMATTLMCSAAMGLPTSGFPNMSEWFLYIYTIFLPYGRRLIMSSGHHEGRCDGPAVPHGKPFYQPRYSKQHTLFPSRRHDRVWRDAGGRDVDKRGPCI